MKGQLIINEMKDKGIEMIGSLNFEKMLMVTDGAEAFMGLKSQKDILILLDKLIDRMAFTVMEIDGDSDIKDVKDAAYYKTIIAISLAILAIGPLTELKEFEDKRAELTDIAKTLTKLAVDVSNLSDNLEIEMSGDKSTIVGDTLMRELEEWEKKRGK